MSKSIEAEVTVNNFKKNQTTISVSFHEENKTGSFTEFSVPMSFGVKIVKALNAINSDTPAYDPEKVKRLIALHPRLFSAYGWPGRHHCGEHETACVSCQIHDIIADTKGETKEVSPQ